jgi:hypothetical protein
VQIGQGRLSDAFDSHKQAFSLFKAILGDRHRLTANARYKLGCHLHKQGKHAAACGMFEQALDTYGGNAYFRNEAARTTYILGRAQIAAGMTEAGTTSIEMATAEFKEIRPSVNASQLTEEHFDNLVMSWFR